MSFFKSLKRGLGFSDDDTEADDILFADTAEDTSPSQEQKKVGVPTPLTNSTQVEPVTFDHGKQELIFEKVLQIFNESLPSFLSNSIDRQAQVKYLRESLDSGVKAYLDSLQAAAEAYCEARWKQTRESMSAELDAIKAKAGDIEKKSADMQQKQLSADRQRRALSDRVHDLEAQVVTLEAEREQFELENRSLVNRLKVAGVQQEDVDSARTEIERLKAEIKKMRENPADAQAAQADAMKIQIDEMTQGIQSLKEQNRVSNQMLEEMRKNLASANKRLGERDTQLAEAKDTVTQVTDAMEKKMLEVDEILAANKRTINQQKAWLSERDSRIESLNNTIAENLKMQAKREHELQAEIDMLKRSYAPKLPQQPKNEPKAHKVVKFEEEQPEPTATPVISEDDLSAIEKTFESEEWFTKNPPAPTPSMRSNAATDEFGYKEPPKRDNSRQNPSQLSLF